jgi:putative membrane protein
VTKFEGEGKNASDPDVKAFATKTLPTLREHLQLAREVAKKEGVSVSE